jgi:hypothetical protein
MNNDYAEIVGNALCFWKSNKGYDAGVLLAAGTKLNEWPPRGAAVLELAVTRTGFRHPLILRTIEIARDSEKWWLGHRVVDDLRHEFHEECMKWRRSNESQLEIQSSVVSLAEMVARVSYNASEPMRPYSSEVPEPFDEDVDAWLVSLTLDLVNKLSDEKFGSLAWKLLTEGACDR